MKDFIIALQFMTRVSINKNIEFSSEDFGKSQKAFIFVGLFLGLFMAAVYKLTYASFPPLVVGSLLIFAELFITGGLLLDGFMDTADGVFSARPKEQALEIMKDSRVGAHAVTSVLLLFLVKFAVYSSLDYFRDPMAILILTPVIGRWFMLFSITYFSYARKEGIGRYFKDTNNKMYFYFSTIVFLIIAFLLTQNVFVFAAILVSFLLALGIGIKLNNFLGGLTGDTYGALTESIQGIFLVVAVLFLA